MKTAIAISLICVTMVLASCDALQTLAPAIASARNFAFAYKKLPDGTSLATARQWMEARHGGPRPGFPAEDSLYFFSDTILTVGSLDYSGNKPNNTADFRLQALPVTSSNHGQLFIRVRDGNVQHGLTSGHIGSTGANIAATPLPQTHDTITSADFHFFVTEDGDAELPTEGVNMNDPNSYFRLVLNSLDQTLNTASGAFEGLAVVGSGPHAGRIYAITEGEFLMDIRN